MANYANTVWTAAQWKLNEMMQMPEFKAKPSAALSVFLKNTDFLVPASERERMWNQKPSDQHTAYIETINKQSISTGSARAAAHTGNVGDSTATAISYTTYSATFKYSVKRADLNVFSTAETLAAQLRSAAIALHSDIETALMTYLNTNKTQVVVSSSPQSGAWDGSNYIFQVADAYSAQYFQNLKMFMMEQYYSGNFDVVNNVAAAIQAGYLAQQGTGNATNLGWQLDGMNMVTSTELSNASGYDWMSYIIPEGTVGILPWIPNLNRQGFGDTFKTGGFYSNIFDPLGSGLQFAYHEYSTAADNDSNGSETQDIDIQCEMSIDLAEVKAPMSTSNLTPIVKAGKLQ